MTALIVHCTCPDAATAERIGTTLVDDRLAACVTRIPGVQSTYCWSGRVHTDTEILLLIKTTRALRRTRGAHRRAASV